MGILALAVAIVVATLPFVRHGVRGPVAKPGSLATPPTTESISVPMPLLMLEQLAGLPDNPEAMRQALFSIAGPDAILRVDGFEGGLLPPKNHIESIHIGREVDGATMGPTIIGVRSR